jgi:hypothetical protein
MAAVLAVATLAGACAPAARTVTAGRPFPWPIDVSEAGGCRADDLPGYRRPRWITPSAGFLNDAGTAWIQCGVSRWPDAARAASDLDRRRGTLDATARWLAEQAIPGESLEPITVEGVPPGSIAFEQALSRGLSRHTWLVVFVDRRYLGFVAIHSATPDPVATAQDFTALTALVVERVRALP